MIISGLPYTYHHDSWVNFLRQKSKLPEDALYKVLYDSDVPDAIKSTVKINNLYHIYKNMSRKTKVFSDYVKSKWNKSDLDISGIDLDKSYKNVSGLENVVGNMVPVLSEYKNIKSIVDHIGVYNRVSTAFVLFWTIDTIGKDRGIPIACMYAINRCKLMYVDRGIRIRKIMCYLPSASIAITFDMDYRYPIEVIIDMAGSGYTLGGYVDRTTFEGRSIKAKWIEV